MVLKVFLMVFILVGFCEVIMILCIIFFFMIGGMKLWGDFV